MNDGYSGRVRPRTAITNATTRLGATLLPVLLTLASPADAQEPIWGNELIGKMDSLAAATLAEGMVSGLAVGVQRDGRVLVARGYGQSDLEASALADAETIFGIGSVSKQFTAAAIMLLIRDGVLSLDDPIQSHLTDYPEQSAVITIRHLLTHTSGIPSYPSEDAVQADLAVDLSDEAIRARFESLPLDFTPGESFRYSNSAYLLLGMIIATASEQPYATFMKERVFEPLGLSKTSYCDPVRIMPGRARGYWIANGELVHAAPLSMTHVGAAGAICSTVPDLLTWSRTLRDGSLISADEYRMMATPTALPGGPELPYGFGLRVETRLEGHANVSHGGGVNGYHAQVDHFPDADLDVVVVSNTNGLHARRFADMIARWALGIPAPQVEDLSVSLDEISPHVGVYPVQDRDWIVSENGGHLFLKRPGLDRERLKAQSDGSFVPATNDYTRLTFVVGDDGSTSGVSIYQCVPTDHQRCRTLEAARTR